MRIRIHERGGQRVTDPELAQILASKAPLAFRKAQDLLVAVQKYRNGTGGWFSTSASRRKAVEREFVALAHALIEDGYVPSNDLHKYENSAEGLIIDFLSEFSDAFPNWQNEYETINDILGHKWR